MKKSLPKIVCIVGPTASGKTALSLRLAKKFDGEVINADSRQVYKVFDIGTGKPPGKRGVKNGRRAYLVDGVPHYLMDFLPPEKAFTVPEWRDATMKAVRGITRREHLPLVVGGTGLYIQALIDNFQFPQIAPNPTFRAALETKPLAELVKLLINLDPDAEQDVDLKNPRRVIRALEVVTFTGKPFTKQKITGKPLVDALQIAIDWPRDELYRRNDAAVETMIEDGWVDEIKRALKKKVPETAPAMTSIGYRELLRAIKGEMSMRGAADATKQAVRRYAKRQMTWFRKDQRIKWVKDEDEAMRLVEKWIKK